MKTFIKYIWPSGRFRIEGQRLDLFLVTKYIKNQSYPNMSIVKVGLLFLYSSMEKKIRRIRPIFDIEK